MYRILYIDDEPGILELVRLYLESFGTLMVDTCPSAEDAEDLISQKGYDTIVLDYYMPDLNGIDFLKSIRSKGNECPIIIYTGRGREDVVIDALNNGADFYLQKFGEPTTEFADLYSKVLKAIRKYHAEKRVKETSALLRSTLESTADGILVVSTAGKITAWNRKFIEMWNIPFHLIEGGDYSTILSYILPQVKDTNLFLSNEGKRRGGKFISGLDVIILKDNRIYERNSQPQMIDGELIGKVWSFRDITARKKAETALIESEERFRLLFEQAPIPYVSLDDKGHIIEVNEACNLTLGYEKSEIYGHPLIEFIPAGQYPDYLDFINSATGDSSILKTEVEIIHKNGTLVPVILNGRLLLDMKGYPFKSLWTLIDISEQRFIESQKNDAINQIQRNLAELAVLNDEIRNPLTVISGLAQIQMGDEASEIMVQVNAIDQMIDQLDSRWFESKKILNYLQRHHGVRIQHKDSRRKNEDY